MIARAVNELLFVVLGGNFNKDGFRKCISFKSCLDLGLINFLDGCSDVIMLIKANSQGMTKTIDFLFVSLNLVNAVVDCRVFNVGEFFDINHQAVFVSVGLGGLLDMWLNSFHKQANRDHWKFNFKDADKNKWNNFMSATSANAAMFLNDSDDVFTKESSKFHKLELLVSRIIKASHEESFVNFDSFIRCWVSLDNSYCTAKLVESLRAKEANIRLAINKRIKSFKINKSHIIKSMLECLFYKLSLDHLVVNNKLILKPDLIKFKTRKHEVVNNISSNWYCQYQLLEYVFDENFSGVISSIGFNKLVKIVSDLLDGKAAGFSGVSNKLWKHCDKSVLDMLLVFLNSCLFSKFVSSSWKEAWISTILKPYKWEGVLTNTYSIALIKTAYKILSKIFSDRISLAYSKFDVLYGDNFLVLKIGCEHLKKGLVRIKMCSKVMTDFGLTDSYCVHNSLDQGEMFFSLLWCIFYDPLLCEARLFSFFAASAFINNTIWVGSSQRATQHILDIASEFFWINDISINNDKTVAIPINSKISNSSLFISGLSISITKKGESYQYLGIFLLTEGLSKPSLAKAHLNVCFFTNLVLRKAVSDKQFLYLVLAVFYPIVSYRTQFSFVSVDIGLKIKSGLPFNFLSNMIHHPLFYGLKSFLQIQSESKIASLVSFVNFGGCWCSVYLLVSPVCTHIGISNNFLVDMFYGEMPISIVLGKSKFVKFFLSLQWYNIAFVDQLHNHHGAVFNWYIFKWWKKLDSHGSVPKWFKLSALFGHFWSNDFVSICDHLLQIDTGVLSVYVDESLKNLDTASCKAGTATFFENISLGLGVGISGLMSFILAELHAIVLALECVPLSNSVCLFSDNQSALDVCKSEMGLVCSDFHNQCWVKGHSGFLGNKCIDRITGTASLSGWHFFSCLDEHFIVTDNSIVFGNSRCFIYDIYHSICCARWEVGSGSRFLESVHSLLMWHSNLHMATGFTSQSSASAHIRFYLSVLCLYCNDVEVSDHVFFCRIDKPVRHQLLDFHVDFWKTLSGFTHSSSCVLQLISSCTSGSFVSMAFFKGFVFDSWFGEAISVFHNSKVASVEVVKFVHSLSMAFRDNIWLVYIRHYTYIEKNGLIPFDGSVPVLVSGLALRFSADVLKLLGIVNAFGIRFGFHKSYSFFSDISGSVFIYIAA
ncbi:hypothetical protein G9A89_003356 [Geosiphon pyriformis]|nr:hypothetical protein G9A89_003356 [Geosiphon pyriformis]